MRRVDGKAFHGRADGERNVVFDSISTEFRRAEKWSQKFVFVQDFGRTLDYCSES